MTNLGKRTDGNLYATITLKDWEQDLGFWANFKILVPQPQRPSHYKHPLLKG